MNIDVEEKKVAVEAISVLIHIKQTMVDLLLKPSHVPNEIYSPLLHRRDEITNRPLSKRKIAPIIVDEIGKLWNGDEIIRNIIGICANWNSFHLAENEFEARAVVEKAKQVLSKFQDADEKEAQLRVENERQKEAEKRSQIETNLRLLLQMFDDLGKSENHQQRGYLLQDLLNRVFTLFEIPVVKSFQRNEGGEQIDGAFAFQGWHYLVECKWTKKLADIRELDSLLGKVNRSGKQTMGFFISIEGWSENIPPLLKQNPEKSIILMDGYDLRCVLCHSLELEELLRGKIAKLNLEAEPFYSAINMIK
jgi:hypothetical protein